MKVVLNKRAILENMGAVNVSGAATAIAPMGSSLPTQIKNAKILEEGINANNQGRNRRNFDGVPRKSSLSSKISKNNYSFPKKQTSGNAASSIATKAALGTVGVGTVLTGAVLTGKKLAEKADDIKSSITPNFGIDDITNN